MFISGGNIGEHLSSFISTWMQASTHEERSKKWDKLISEKPHKVALLQSLLDIGDDIKPSKLSPFTK